MPPVVDYKTLLNNWSVIDEQRRADFIDWLYWVYERNNGLYTGLWQQFRQDLVELARNNLNEDQSFVELFVGKINVLNEERRIKDNVAV
jgi:hypothetical protein